MSNFEIWLWDSKIGVFRNSQEGNGVNWLFSSSINPRGAISEYVYLSWLVFQPLVDLSSILMHISILYCLDNKDAGYFNANQVSTVVQKTKKRVAGTSEKHKREFLSGFLRNISKKEQRDPLSFAWIKMESSGVIQMHTPRDAWFRRIFKGQFWFLAFIKCALIFCQQHNGRQNWSSRHYQLATMYKNVQYDPWNTFPLAVMLATPYHA